MKLLDMIPLPYRILGGVLGLIAILGATYFYGLSTGSAKADTAIAEFSAEKNAQIAELEKKNAELSNRVQIEYVDRVNTIREREYIYRDVATNTVPTQQNMSNGWVEVHDASAALRLPNTGLASDGAPSSVSDIQSLAVVVSNYSRCQQNAQQLALLQQWISENRERIEKENKR